MGTVVTHAATVPVVHAPGTRTIRIGSGPVEAAIWQRNAIPPGAIVPGPAIVEQADTTILIEPGWTARLVAGGTLLLERCT